MALLFTTSFGTHSKEIHSLSSCSRDARKKTGLPRGVVTLVGSLSITYILCNFNFKIVITYWSKGTGVSRVRHREERRKRS